MKTSNILMGLAATALLGSFSAANASHLPSPCAGGEPGAGTNCMYIVAGGSAANTYEVSGNRSALTTSTIALDIWIDFGTLAVQGGGFDIALSGDTVTSMSWAWGPDFTAGEQTLHGAQSGQTWAGIQFDDFAGNGFGGTTGTQPGFSLVGTLTVVMAGGWAQLVANIQQPYTDGTFPNCFAPGAGSGGSGCVDTNFYSLTANPVPLPAAVWMMLAGLGSLGGFARRKAA